MSKTAVLLSAIDEHAIVVFFFFFQAEDGIRDIGVTGVQTCALPIFHRLHRTPLPASPTDYEAIEKWERLHKQFHMSLIAACGSPWRLHFCSILSDQFERYRRGLGLLPGDLVAPAPQVGMVVSASFST